MAVSPSRVREIRAQLEDAARDLEGDDTYAELGDVVGAAVEEFDQLVDGRGEPTAAPDVEVGARVKRTPDDLDVTDEQDSPDAPDAADPKRKRKLPPQFGR